MLLCVSFGRWSIRQFLYGSIRTQSFVTKICCNDTQISMWSIIEARGRLSELSPSIGPSCSWSIIDAASICEAENSTPELDDDEEEASKPRFRLPTLLIIPDHSRVHAFANNTCTTSYENEKKIHFSCVLQMIKFLQANDISFVMSMSCQADPFLPAEGLFCPQKVFSESIPQRQLSLKV